MTDVEKVAKLLEDISISSQDYFPEDEYNLQVEESPEPSSAIDAKTLQLLELLDKYENKVMRQMDINFKNGYLNLSRANYNSGSVLKKFGVESIDMREHLANKSVEFTGDGIKLVDLFEKNKEEKKYNLKDKKKTKESITSENATEKTEGLRNRKLKSLVTLALSTQETQEGPQFRNPLHQFGGLVPYQLRQSQTYFNNGLEDAVALIQLRSEILSLIEEVEILRAQENT